MHLPWQRARPAGSLSKRAVLYGAITMRCGRVCERTGHGLHEVLARHLVEGRAGFHVHTMPARHAPIQMSACSRAANAARALMSTWVPTGMFQSKPGSVGCLSCASLGKYSYQDLHGQTSCTKCAENTEQWIGISSPANGSTCLCSKGPCAALAALAALPLMPFNPLPPLRLAAIPVAAIGIVSWRPLLARRVNLAPILTCCRLLAARRNAGCQLLGMSDWWHL